jgi:CelD/BcsL family acetyltransferase involved in cellulose biosynthesis
VAHSISLPWHRRSAALPAGATASDLTVQTISGDAGLIDALAGEWRELAATEPRTRPMQTPEWIATDLRHHAPDARLVVVTVRRGGRLRALLPLVRESIRYHGVPLTRLRYATDALYPVPVDLVHAAGERTPVVAAIWRQLAADTSWDLLELADVAEGTALRDLYQLAAAAGFPTAARRNRLTPILTLPGPGATFETAAAHVNAKFRATVRRRKRRLEEVGPVAFRRIETADPAELERFFALEASGWKGRNGSAILSSPIEHAFYAELARATAARGAFTLYSLECAGEPVAMQLGMTLHGRYHLPKVAFDEAKGAFSPGHILMQEIVRDAAERGLTEIDFLGNADDWKARWANTERSYDRLSIFRPTVAGRLGHAIRFHLLPAANHLRAGLRSHRGAPETAASTSAPGD